MRPPGATSAAGMPPIPTAPSGRSPIARSIKQLLDDDDIAVGVAASRLVAEIAARQAGPRRIHRVAPGEEAAFLAPLPLSVLPMDPAVSARLAALGLDCVGAVANLSAADLQRQFGPAGMDLWRRARGGDGVGEWQSEHGLGLSGPPRRLGERLVLEGGTGDLEALRFAVHRSALELGDRLRRRGCRAAAVTLVCELEDAEPSGCGSPRCSRREAARSSGRWPWSCSPACGSRRR